MKLSGFRTPGIFALATLLWNGAESRGVTPYLPLKMDPKIERQIERVLQLADKTVVRRPIPASIVLEALPAACKSDQELCDEVSDYLQRYMRRYGVTSLRGEGTLTSGDSTSALPNAHGRTVESRWLTNASAYFQPNDYTLLTLAGMAQSDNATPTGSMLSVGFDYAQLDLGFKDHWFSPLTDSSSLIGVEAATMPSISLSNYEPISRLGLSYEIFAADMSNQEGIAFFSTTTSGKPRLAGMQLAIAPVDGYAIAVNRVLQYGGGARRSGGISDFFSALIKNSNSGANGPDTVNGSEEFGNQVASITSTINFPARVPFGVRLEYAGEDNAYATGYRLGAINMSLGVDLPLLWKDFDATFEVSEWQNDWYVHHLYPEGLTNRGNVIGHWFGDQRVFGNAIGGNSEMLRVGWRRAHNDYLQAVYRSMRLDTDWAKTFPVPPYRTMQSLGLNWSTAWRNIPFALEVNAGRDIFGEKFARISGSIDFADLNFQSREDSATGSIDEGDRESVDFFVDAGVNRSSVLKLLVIGQPSPPILSTYGAHVGMGARRIVSKHSDLGFRLELDEIEGSKLLSLRALDYRYRITHKIAANGFLGYGRYDLELPAYGYYWGLGAQYLDVLPRWDIGFDVRHYEKLSRDKVLPTDPPASVQGHPRMYFDIDSMSLYLTYRW